MSFIYKSKIFFLVTKKKKKCIIYNINSAVKKYTIYDCFQIPDQSKIICKFTKTDKIIS